MGSCMCRLCEECSTRCPMFCPLNKLYCWLHSCVNDIWLSTFSVIIDVNISDSTIFCQKQHYQTSQILSYEKCRLWMPILIVTVKWTPMSRRGISRSPTTMHAPKYVFNGSFLLPCRWYLMPFPNIYQMQITSFGYASLSLQPSHICFWPCETILRENVCHHPATSWSLLLRSCPKTSCKIFESALNSWYTWLLLLFLLLLKISLRGSCLLFLLCLRFLVCLWRLLPLLQNDFFSEYATEKNLRSHFALLLKVT